MSEQHDPLCPWQPSGELMPGAEAFHRCQCGLIEDARADEREKAVQRVAAIKLVTSRPDGFLVYLDDAVAAVRGES